jgi:hypothetical protein
MDHNLDLRQMGTMINVATENCFTNTKAGNDSQYERGLESPDSELTSLGISNVENLHCS